MKISWGTKIATLTLGASLALVAPQATAAPNGEGLASAGQVPSSTSASSATELPTDAMPQALPCGFGFWQQSYRNCEDTAIYVIAPAHESQTNEWIEYQYCLEPGESRQPLAVWGMWVWLAQHLEVDGC
ncbi:hypothetical protein [Ornithinimicrobium faecis]|uniref:hypothetical protein n=1 Tax=Ornithinimicrobium faecis TaxID=2934158 RepID=UPI002117F201|nr:hypothetical protein [Ornithinimicrobium sp. HY1745]